MRKVPFLLLFAFLSVSVLPAAEPNQFDKKWTEQVEPHFRSGVFGSFAGEKNITIRYAAFRKEGSDKAIVILPGYAESYLKYREFIYDLNRLGYSVYVMDHRGQGVSQRFVTNPSMIHIDKFEYMTKDVETFVKNVVRKEHTGRLYLFAHSMGGLIGAQVLADNNVKFDAAIMTAPMFEMALPLPRFLAKSIAGVQVYRGKGSDYALFQSDYDEAKRTKFLLHKTSNSRARFDKFVEQLKAHPELRIGGPSYGWVNTMLNATKKFRSEAKKVRTPVLVLQAGDEVLVSNAAQDKTCKQMVNCQRVVYPIGRHELWRDLNVVRDDVLKRVTTMFK